MVGAWQLPGRHIGVRLIAIPDFGWAEAIRGTKGTQAEPERAEYLRGMIPAV